MKCEKCGFHHRYMITCEEAKMTREHKCDLCQSDKCGAGDLERIYHSRNCVYDDSIFGSEGKQAYKCPECGAVWLVRYQWDAGTGRDDVWWIIELPNVATE